jgi:nitric oxide reductase subunit B
MAAQIPAQANPPQDRLSPWWRRSVVAVMVIGFSVLIFLTIKVHHEAPPIPGKVVDSRGTRLFGKEDIQAGQQVFLKYGLMDNGSIWGHGGYLGPDFSARYLHNLASDVAETLAEQRFGRPLNELSEEERVTVEALTRSELKQNRL